MKSKTETRQCKKCGMIKFLSEFTKTTTGGWRYDCKECVKLQSRVYRSKKHIVSKKDVLIFIRSMMIEKTLTKCKYCGEEKLADQFYTKRAYGKVSLVNTRCKECERWYQIERSFGISKDEFLSFMTKQDDSCAICGIHIDEYKQQGYRNHFSVDHDHKTGKIRGLLCDQCNRGLGLYKDDIEILKTAIEYLDGNIC